MADSKREMDLLRELARLRGEAGDASLKNPAAVMLGRRGGLKGGPARAASMSAERRREIAQLAANKRWRKGD